MFLECLLCTRRDSRNCVLTHRQVTGQGEWVEVGRDGGLRRTSWVPGWSAGAGVMTRQSLKWNSSATNGPCAGHQNKCKSRFLQWDHFLLQGIFPNQGANPSLIFGRQILCHWATWEAHTRISMLSPSLFIWNCHNIVNRLYPNTK